MAYVLVGLGLVGLLVGAEIMLRGAVGLAQCFCVSPLVIGLTVVAFATSAPELVVCIVAALQGAPSLAVGNIVGSNIANILLILGAVAVISPIIVPKGGLVRDALALAGATLAMVAVGLYGVISTWIGAVMLVVLGGYFLYCYRSELKGGNEAAIHETEVEELDHVPSGLGMASILLAIGLALVIGGSQALVDGAVDIATRLGVSEAVIGLTLIAVGTSLPELATAIVAAMRKQVGIALGNVLGSNIMNILGIAGATALVTPIPVPDNIAVFDLWVLLGVTAVLLPPVIFGGRLGRVVALVFLCAYGTYISAQFYGFSGVQIAGS